MKRKIFTLLLLTTGVVAFAQDRPGVGIGTKNINKAAMLEIQATNKGVLIPRIDLKEDTKLNGNVNPEGVIVYNNGTSLAHGFYYWSGSKWEMVVGDTYLTDEIDRVEQHFQTEINNIINGGNGTGTDISYLVSFNPLTNVYSYLKPNATNDGYDLIEINFDEAVNNAETNTFIREIKKTINAGTAEEKEVTEAYVYFNEDAIKAWKATHTTGNVVDDIDNNDGVTIDVLGVVNNNFKEIFENTVNTEIINQIIKEAPYNVWVEERTDGTYLVYVDEHKVQHDVNLSMQETQTSILKHDVETDQVAPTGKAIEIVDETQLKTGEIYYSYEAEHGKKFYISLTQDIITSVQKNTTLKKEIFDIVNEYNNTTGGNVYYGKINGSQDDILYIIVNDVPQPIDISKDILKVIEDLTNNTIIEKILDRIEIAVKDDQSDVPTGSSIDGAKVYRGKRTINVSNTDGYDVTFTNVLVVNPTKKVVDTATNDFVFEPTNEKIESLLSVAIMNKTTKQLVATSVTDVTVTTDNKVSFYFGLGMMYQALDNGDYEVVLEYTAR